MSKISQTKLYVYKFTEIYWIWTTVNEIELDFNSKK